MALQVGVPAHTRYRRSDPRRGRKVPRNAAQVFTSIAAVASALGVTWKGVGSAIPKLASDAEKPIFGLEEVEAMAWSITTLPDATVNMRGIRYLRKAGITPPVPLGRY